MKISYNWLQKHIEEKLPPAKELADKITFHAFEVESVEELGGDSIISVDVLPNRAGDCLSHFGMAREVAGLLGLTLKHEKLTLPEMKLEFPVEVQTELCRRYIAIEVAGVKVGESPAWLKEALESIGQRSINNIVDATNYVLNDYGQPVHAFDKSKIDGGIVVRLAKENERIITLSDEEKNLRVTDIAIADYLGILAIAGVKGGKSAEVSAETSTIIIEVANFDPISVRKTSRSLNLITDASKRFENNFSPEDAYQGAAQVLSLILSIAGGQVVGVKDIYPSPAQERKIEFNTTEVSRPIGTSITTEVVKNVLDQFKFTYEQKEDNFTLTVPHYRNDLNGAHDITEEVGRVIGYDKLSAALLPFKPEYIPNPAFEGRQAVRTYLIDQGFSEVMTYTFRKKGEVYVSYGAKDKSALRTNLSDGIKESYELNRLNAPLLGLSEVKIFEIGTVFINDKEEVHVATVDKGTIQELPIDMFIAEHKIEIEKINSPTVTSPAPFKPWSQYPFITRDIAVWAPSEDSITKLEDMYSKFADKYCVRQQMQFDRFEKEGKISVAYRFVFQSNEKTLTDDEVTKIFSELLEELKKHEEFTIR